jgi:drug/metabolite transporter (DMT)-like permease
MSRFRADLILVLVSLIWGTAFVAQKGAFNHVGPYTFIAARFLISAVLVFPLAWREYGRVASQIKSWTGKCQLISLCAAFCGGVLLQQVGIGMTSVTNAGFLTGLYVILVPVICAVFFKQKLSPWVFPAAFVSIAGVWLLAGGKLNALSFGDWLILLCAISFAAQVALVGRVMAQIKAPFSLSWLQYVVVTLLAGILAFTLEDVAWGDLRAAALSVLYAGVISGGIAYTLQVVAQQYAPAPDAAIIMSGEAIFAAIAGALMMGEDLTALGYLGCGLIIIAVLLVELAPMILKSATFKNKINAFR